MIRVFSGEDRVAAEKAVRGLLGAEYEVFEGGNLQVDDLPSIFQGSSLFATEGRKILLKNLTENTAVWAKVPEYLTTEHEVVIWEPKIDKRSACYKALKAAGVEMREFALQQPPEVKQVFKVFDVALKDGAQAVKMVENLEMGQDPYMFFGLLVTQALRLFEGRQGKKERAVLKELAKTDLELKTTSVEPWLLVKSFLLRMSSLG